MMEKGRSPSFDTLRGHTTQPAAGLPLHVQHREDEAFFALEGEYALLVEGEILWVVAGYSGWRRRMLWH